MKPRLIFPFEANKQIQTMVPNEEGLNPKETWSYRVFPVL